MIDPEVGGQIFAPGTGTVTELAPLPAERGARRRATGTGSPR